MQVQTGSFTVAEYCDQMREGIVKVNPAYQRSSQVWPPAAQSYLIDTILLGFPIPKLLLYQRTDLRTRRTVKEIVDGQQRSHAILRFYNDDLRIGRPSDYAGKTYSTLDPESQQRFVEYGISADVLVGATEEQVRQIFKRMNSYMIPLKEQEKRHAEFQGEFKWYMVRLTDRYAETLKRLETFTERQLVRMADAELLTAVLMAFEKGIISHSQNSLDAFYESHEREFDAKSADNRIDAAFEMILRWQPIHGTTLTKPAGLYSLLLAVSHCLQPVPALDPLFPLAGSVDIPDDIRITSLSRLAAAVEEEGEEAGPYKEFVAASTAGTNSIEQRKTRFCCLCSALTSDKPLL